MGTFQPAFLTIDAAGIAPEAAEGSPMSTPNGAHDEAPSGWIRWRLTGLVTVGILTVLFIMYLGRGALLPIIMSVIVASLIFPVVAFIEGLLPIYQRHPRISRLFAIAVVYAGFLAVMSVFMFLTVQPVYVEMREFFQNAPEIYEQAKTTVEDSLEELDQQVPEEVKEQAEEWLQSACGAIGDAALGKGSRPGL